MNIIPNRDKAQFLSIIFLELTLFPYFYLKNYIFNKLSSKDKLKVKKKRNPIQDKTIYINIHEWGGYNLKRHKNKINNNINGFECGLYYQLLRFKKPYNDNINLTVTLSDPHLSKSVDFIKNNCDKLIFVSNDGMDFSGYSEFYLNIKDLPNSYVILTNSSVNKDISNSFLKEYIDYMNENPDVGILGISYCTKIYQTLIRNNFNPHLQSYFILSTIDVLKEIVHRNNEIFPGKGIKNKFLLIRKGEVKVSKIAQKLGYNLGVVLTNGEVYKFGMNNKYDNGFNRWDKKMGDMRLYVREPNKINKIIK